MSRYQARLETVVTRYSGCLATLGPRAAQVLVLRSGVGVDRPYTPQQVAGQLHISLPRETNLERTGLTQLQSAGRSGRCGSTLVVLSVPSQDHLVPVSPVFVLDSAPTGSNANVAQTGVRGGTSSAVRAATTTRPAGTVVALRSATVSLPAVSTPVTVLILGGAGLLLTLVLLSALGQRLAAREQAWAVAGAGGGAATGTAAAASPQTNAAATASPPAEVPATEAPANTEEAPAPYIPAPVPTNDAQTDAQTDEFEAVPAPEAPTPEAATPPTHTPSVAGVAASIGPAEAERTSPAASQNGDWLRTHRSHIAFALTAVAGGALRAFARSRTRGGRRR